MSKEFISSKTGLKEIEVPCMKCELPVKVTVPANFKRKMRKFCVHCKKALGTENIFSPTSSDGNRRVSVTK